MRRTWIGFALLLAGAAVLVLFDAGTWALATWFLTPTLFGMLPWVERDPRSRIVPFVGVVAVASVPYALRLAGVIGDNVASLPEWDFMGFWLHARSAVRGLDFYDPAHAQTLATAFTFSDEFRREIVDVGFWYPPPSMFVFAPLGWFPPHTAIVVWYAAQCAALVAAGLLLARGVAVGAAGACVTLALLLICAGTWTTFSFAQSNLLALVALLAFWRRPDHAAGGVWLAVAAVIKPFLLLLAIVPLLRGRWRTIAATVATLATLAAASAAVFGPRTFLHSLAGDPVSTKPDWIYHEAPTQSLLALILRAGGVECRGIECLTQPVYLALAAVIGVLLIVALFVRRRGPVEPALAAVLATLLFVYPLSGLSYSVFLIPVVVLAWRRRAHLPGGAWTAALATAATFALAEMHDGTQTVFAFLVAMALAMTLRMARGRGADSAADVPA